MSMQEHDSKSKPVYIVVDTPTDKLFRGMLYTTFVVFCFIVFTVAAWLSYLIINHLPIPFGSLS